MLLFFINERNYLRKKLPLNTSNSLDVTLEFCPFWQESKGSLIF